MNPYESGAVIDMNIGHNSATPAPIGADALREALWTCVEHNALHFGENHNTVVQGRAALAGAAHAATPKAAPPPAVQQGEPIGYLAAYEIDRLKQGHDGRLRSPKFGPSPLDSDVPVYLGPLPTAGALALVQKWRHAAGHLGLAGLASLADCADELEATLRTSRGQAPEPAAVAEPVAWLHDDPQRYDVIHAEVKDLLVKFRDAAGYLHRPLDKAAHYTIPLYTAPAPAAERDRCAAVCERIGNEYAESDRFKCPEMKMDAESGARSCAYAIRAGDGEAGNA